MMGAIAETPRAKEGTDARETAKHNTFQRLAKELVLDSPVIFLREGHLHLRAER